MTSLETEDPRRSGRVEVSMLKFLKKKTKTGNKQQDAMKMLSGYLARVQESAWPL